MVHTTKNSDGLVKGIDFKVRLEPAVYMLKGKPVEVPNRWATVRCDNNEPMAIVGSEYKPQDHRENLRMIADILSNSFGDFTVTHRVSGPRIYSDFILDTKNFLPKNAKSKEGAKVRVKTVNSYDGNLSFRSWMDIYRQICSNGMHGFVPARELFDVRKIHSKKLDLSKIIGHGLELGIDAYMKRYSEFYAKLVEKKPVKEAILLKELPVKLVASAIEKFKTEEEQNAWGQYNSFTNIITHSEIREERKEMLTNNVSRAYLKLVA